MSGRSQRRSVSVGGQHALFNLRRSRSWHLKPRPLKQWRKSRRATCAGGRGADPKVRVPFEARALLKRVAFLKVRALLEVAELPKVVFAAIHCHAVEDLLVGEHLAAAKAPGSVERNLSLLLPLRLRVQRLQEIHLACTEIAVLGFRVLEEG